MKRETGLLGASDPVALLAFLPLGTLGVYFLYRSIPLRWTLLAGVLKAVSLVSFCSNLLANDVTWSTLSLCSFLLVSLSAYFNTLRMASKEDITQKRWNHSNKVISSELLKTCSDAVFSDYKISLLSKIPLAIQVLVAGSVVYSIFGLDWIMHAMAGVGICAVSLKAYKTAVGDYGYETLASYFHLGGFKSFRAEGKWASANWALFCLVVVTVSWELFERAVYFISPSNIMRIGLEPLWDSAGDVIFGILGGMMAWYLMERRLHWV
jgi:hypothetical protein